MKDLVLDYASLVKAPESTDCHRSPSCQLLLGFKDPDKCSNGNQRNCFIRLDKYSWTSVTAISELKKTCLASSVKQPPAEGLNCIKTMNGSPNISHLGQKLQGSETVSRTVLPGSILHTVPGHIHGCLVLPEHFLFSVATHAQLWISIPPLESCAGQVRRQHCVLSTGQLSYQPN